MQYFKWLKSGWAVLIGAGVGAYIGHVQVQYVSVVEPLGELYLSILQMCILPILLTAISLSIGRLIKQTDNKQFLSRLVITFVLSLLFASTLGATIGYLVGPGNGLEDDLMNAIGSIIIDASKADIEVDLFEVYKAPENSSFMRGLFNTLVPSNIFSALNNGYTIKILFFAILFGIAIGSLKKQTSEHIFLTFDAIYNSFSKLVQWLMYIFPLGICGLIASSLSKIDTTALSAMVEFVPLVILTFIIWFLIMCIVMKVRTGSFSVPLKALKEPIVISLSTSNTMASLPAALEAMHTKLGYEKKKIDLLIPLTFTLCRIGPTLYFSLATMFVVQLYGVEMTGWDYIVVVFGSVLAGTATAGSSGVSLLTMLGIVSGPLGVPLDAVLILFVVIDPIIAPFRVLAIVHSSCALITIIFPKTKVVADTSEIPNINSTQKT
ncbi:MAG: dicarboxylate/amino acid:cation symporter [Colwellia sp.]